MFLSTLVKISRTYLLLVGVIYIVVGIVAIFNTYAEKIPDSINGIYSLLLLSSLLFLSFIVIPSDLFSGNDIGVGVATHFGPLFFLGIAAVILGILSLIALRRSIRDMQWVYVLYGLSILALLLALWNLSVDTQNLGSFVNASLFLLTTWLLHLGLRFERSKINTPTVNI